MKSVAHREPRLGRAGTPGMLHRLDRLARKDLGSVDRAAVEQELDVARHVHRRRVDRAGRSLDHVPVGIRRHPIGVVQRHHPVAERWVAKVGRRGHPDRQEHPVADQRVERTPLELLGDVRRDRRARIAVGDVGAGAPARGAGARGVVEPLLEGERRRVAVGVVAEGDVVPAGGVFEQVHDAHRVGGLPPVGVADLGRVLRHRVVELELPFLLQHQDQQGGERLRRGADPVEALDGGVLAGGDVGLAEAGGPEDAVAVHQGDADRRHLVLRHDVADPALQLRRGGRGVAASPWSARRWARRPRRTSTTQDERSAVPSIRRSAS